MPGGTGAGPWYRRISWRFLTITLVFIYTTIANVYEKPDGIKIATFFILTILVTSFWSRYARSRELRFAGFKLPGPGNAARCGTPSAIWS